MCSGRRYIGKHLMVIVGMYIWADVARNALEMAKPRPLAQSMMRAGVEREPDRKGLAPPASDAPAADQRVASSDTCWAPDPLHGVRRLPEPEYLIEGNAIQAAGERPSEHFVPSPHDGVTHFRLVTVGQDGLYAKLGFRNDDILISVNGYAMHDDIEAALTVYRNLRDCNLFEVIFERQGAVLRRTYHMGRRG